MHHCVDAVLQSYFAGWAPSCSYVYTISPCTSLACESDGKSCGRGTGVRKRDKERTEQDGWSGKRGTDRSTPCPKTFVILSLFMDVHQRLGFRIDESVSTIVVLITENDIRDVKFESRIIKIDL